MHPEPNGELFPEKPPESHPPNFSWVKARRAAQMAATGSTPEQIAAALEMYDGNGDPDPRMAVRAAQRGLTAVYRFTVDEMRLRELQSLDEMERRLWEALPRGYVLVQQGHVVLGPDKVPVQDERFVLELMDRILKIKERRAKYLGLDAVTRVSVEADQIGGEISRLISQINAVDSVVREALPAGGGGGG